MSYHSLIFDPQFQSLTPHLTPANPTPRSVALNATTAQGIAKKGHYGSFLMDDMELIYKLINTAHTHCNVPITAKMRVFDDEQKSLQYAKMLQVCD